MPKGTSLTLCTLNVLTLCTKALREAKTWVCRVRDWFTCRNDTRREKYCRGDEQGGRRKEEEGGRGREEEEVGGRRKVEEGGGRGKGKRTRGE